nr:hypothetical protein [Tanacetum cinerariifolium]
MKIHRKWNLPWNRYGVRLCIEERKMAAIVYVCDVYLRPFEGIGNGPQKSYRFLQNSSLFYTTLAVDSFGPSMWYFAEIANPSLVTVLGCGYRKPTFSVVIWNPYLGKSIGIIVPIFLSRTHSENVIGFGVCPVTSDPTVVHISRVAKYMPWHVEFFTLSLRVWNEIPTSNILCKSVQLNASTQVVIDRFIYWGAYELTFDNDDKATKNSMFVSFDLITKEFKVVDLPNSLTNELRGPVSVSKLRESLVVYGSINVKGAECCDVWDSLLLLDHVESPIYCDDTNQIDDGNTSRGPL